VEALRGGSLFEQVYEPVKGSLALSTLVALIPIAVLFVLLAALRVVAQWTSLASLAVALIIAVLVSYTRGRWPWR
jgi:lactate permease